MMNVTSEAATSRVSIQWWLKPTIGPLAAHARAKTTQMTKNEALATNLEMRSAARSNQVVSSLTSVGLLGRLAGMSLHRIQVSPGGRRATFAAGRQG